MREDKPSSFLFCAFMTASQHECVALGCAHCPPYLHRSQRYKRSFTKDLLQMVQSVCTVRKKGSKVTKSRQRHPEPPSKIGKDLSTVSVGAFQTATFLAMKWIVTSSNILAHSFSVWSPQQRLLLETSRMIVCKAPDSESLDNDQSWLDISDLRNLAPLAHQAQNRVRNGRDLRPLKCSASPWLPLHINSKRKLQCLPCQSRPLKSECISRTATAQKIKTQENKSAESKESMTHYKLWFIFRTVTANSFKHQQSNPPLTKNKQLIL